MSAETATISTLLNPLGKPGGPGLWGTKGDHLPAYIENIAHAIMRTGKDKSEAIQIAIGKVRDWAEGKGNVSPEVRAAARKAIAEYEATRAKHHAHGSDVEGIEMSAKNHDRVIELSASVLEQAGVSPAAIELAIGQAFRFRHGWIKIDDDGGGSGGKAPVRPLGKSQEIKVRGTSSGFTTSNSPSHRIVSGSGFATSNSNPDRFSQDVLSYAENNPDKLKTGTQLTAKQVRRRVIVSRLAASAAIAGSLTVFQAEAAGHHNPLGLERPTSVSQSAVAGLDATGHRDTSGLIAGLDATGHEATADSHAPKADSHEGVRRSVGSSYTPASADSAPEGGDHGEPAEGHGEEKGHGYGFPRDAGPTSKELSENLKRELANQLAEQIGGGALAGAASFSTRSSLFSGAQLSNTSGAIELAAGEGVAFSVAGKVVTLLKDWSEFTSEQKCGFAVAMTKLVYTPEQIAAHLADGPDEGVGLSAIWAASIELGVPVGHPRAVELAEGRRSVV